MVGTHGIRSLPDLALRFSDTFFKFDFKQLSRDIIHIQFSHIHYMIQ